MRKAKVSEAQLREVSKRVGPYAEARVLGSAECPRWIIEWRVVNGLWATNETVYLADSVEWSQALSKARLKAEELGLVRQH